MKEPENTPNHVKTIGITIIVLVAMAMSYTGYFLKRYVDAPVDFMESTPVFIKKFLGSSAEGIEALAKAVNTRTIKLESFSTAAKLEGKSGLLVATFSQVEFFERTDDSTQWGVPLPDVVVSARAPVEYNYYLDLDGGLDFHLNNHLILYAIVPILEFNKPAVDVSAIEYRVEKGSIIRDHDAAIEMLRKTISEETKKRARKNMHIVRELARRKINRFVQTYINRTFGVHQDFPVEVIFRDEPMPDIVREVRRQVEKLPLE